MATNDISEDSDLTPGEKEVMIRFDKATERLTVHSEVGSVSRALASRDDFEETGTRTNEDGETVSITGHLPLGVLKIQQSERKHGSFSTVVTSHD
jgi:hypothetical protein